MDGKLERAAYEACVGKIPAEAGLGGIYEFFPHGDDVDRDGDQELSRQVPENRIRERFALTLGILKRGAGIESERARRAPERK